MSEYIRGIIFFLVFSSFVGIILPGGKYKSYISIVLGFVVMALVLRPISDLGTIIDGVSEQLSLPLPVQNENYEQNYHMLISDAVKTQMREQMSRAVEVLGYSLLALDADIDVATGEVRSISMTLTDPESSSEIRIAPITLSSAPDDPAANIKKMVSDFYQLPQAHIYVNIQ